MLTQKEAVPAPDPAQVFLKPLTAYEAVLTLWALGLVEVRFVFGIGGYGVATPEEALEILRGLEKEGWPGPLPIQHRKASAALFSPAVDPPAPEPSANAAFDWETALQNLQAFAPDKISKWAATHLAKTLRLATLGKGPATRPVKTLGDVVELGPTGLMLAGYGVGGTTKKAAETLLAHYDLKY